MTIFTKYVYFNRYVYVDWTVLYLIPPGWLGLLLFTRNLSETKKPQNNYIKAQFMGHLDSASMDYN